MMRRLGGTIVSLAVLLFASSGASPTRDKSPATRQFEFTYKVHVPAVPAGSGPLRLWIPLPQSDPFQTITGLRIESPVRYKTGRDTEYSNEYAYFDVDPQHAAAGFDVLLRFRIARREHRVELTRAPSHKPEPAGPLTARFLQPDRLVPLNGVIAELAKEQTQGVTDPLQKAHKVYEYVIATMRYDKLGRGWGRGDAIWACSSKYGNCTDFHSVFIGMMRASGVPARFEIGFPLPSDKTEGDIPGYHCWAEFYVNSFGWVPVDASEAWKNPAKREYFFGAHDTNRVQFTLGRDIRLGPEQKGAPLNYFIYPYAELDGKPFSQLQTHLAFRDWPTTGQTAGGN
ncbi:MAG TPA: transglutaminase domain-containing protein [Candidatus Acidoferrales bacterium]|nr:transglutaminase domain-containing protein [Candidatus Acidoferrales bacterium]